MLIQTHSPVKYYSQNRTDLDRKKRKKDKVAYGGRYIQHLNDLFDDPDQSDTPEHAEDLLDEFKVFLNHKPTMRDKKKFDHLIKSYRLYKEKIHLNGFMNLGLLRLTKEIDRLVQNQ